MNSTHRTVSWTPEPDGRGTIGLIWSCVATIFLCTWSAVHPNVPAEGESQGVIFRRKARYMALCVLAPEVFATFAMEELLELIRFRREYRFTQKCSTATTTCGKPAQLLRPWTLRQYSALRMGGLSVQIAPNQEVRFEPEDTADCIRASLIDASMLKEEDINDRSKADCLTKSIALLQVAWFLAQLLSRTVAHLPVTTLELFTLGIVCCSLITYACCWQKPFDMQRPIVLPAQCTTNQWPEAIERVRFRHISSSHFRSSTHLFVAKLMLCCAIFASAHLIGWDVFFATDKEKWLWRAMGIANIVVPALWVASNLLRQRRDNVWTRLLRQLLMYPYILARIGIMIEVFAALRAVPRGVYWTVNWTRYVPVLG